MQTNNKKNKWVIVAMIVCWFFPCRPSQAVVLFEDSFDSSADWTVTQPLPADQNCSSGCGIPGGWDGYYNGRSWCNGGPGSNNFYINSTAGYPVENSTSQCRGGGGKCVTYWDESCNDFFEDSNGVVGVDLGQEYQEIWVRFFIKFGRKANGQDYQIGYLDSDSPQHKLLRFHAYDGISNMFGTYCTVLGNYPMDVWGWDVYSDGFYQYWGQRCWSGATNYDDCMASYYCNNSLPTWSYDINDMNYTLVSNSFDNSLGDGNWHSVEVRKKLNTYNSGTGHWQNDGITQVWYDGVEYDNRTNVVYLEDGATPGSRGWRMIGIGGNNSNLWTTSCTGTGCEQWYSIDDFVVATEYIGPEYVIGGSIPPASPTGLSVQ